MAAQGAAMGVADWRAEPAVFRTLLRTVAPGAIPRGTLVLTVSLGSGDRVAREEWWLRAGVGAGRAWQHAGTCSSMVLWPQAAVACRVSADGALGCVVEGMAFAGLPTGISTGLPVHVNARWALADNRTSIVWDSSPSHREQREWNQALLSDAVPVLWLELLLDLRRSALSGSINSIAHGRSSAQSASVTPSSRMPWRGHRPGIQLESRCINPWQYSLF